MSWTTHPNLLLAEGCLLRLRRPGNQRRTEFPLKDRPEPEAEDLSRSCRRNPASRLRNARLYTRRYPKSLTMVLVRGTSVGV